MKQRIQLGSSRSSAKKTVRKPIEAYWGSSRGERCRVGCVPTSKANRWCHAQHIVHAFWLEWQMVWSHANWIESMGTSHESNTSRRSWHCSLHSGHWHLSLFPGPRAICETEFLKGNAFLTGCVGLGKSERRWQTRPWWIPSWRPCVPTCSTRSRVFVG
jgi:hypothetical protein